MEQLTPRAMAATPWLLLLCLAVATGGSGVLRARAQPDSKGFITIDCGLQGETGFVDNVTTLAFAPDNGEFTDDAGTCHNISAEYITPSLGPIWYTVRSFAAGARNCYTLRSLVPGLKYLVRARFMYSNYDGLNRFPVFDLHVGVNYWYTVNITSQEGAKNVEAIVVVPDDFLQVCLINTGGGTPFISGLDLRPLKKTIYPQATKVQGLVLLARFNFGPTDRTQVIRYPDDPHDRFWFPLVNSVLWTEMTTTSKVQNMANDPFEAPPAVLRTAIRPRNGSQLQFSWEPQPQANDPSPAYFVIMHFTELQLLPFNAPRELYINLNGELWLRDAVIPVYLTSGASYNTFASRESQYNITINATANSTLPPIINAVEVFSVIPTTNLGTDNGDVSAIMEIKAKYQVRARRNDLHAQGRQFTWANRRDNPTYEKLDRVLASVEWEQKFLLVLVRTLRRSGSDHTPPLIDYGYSARGTLDSPMVFPPPGGSAGKHGFWMHLAPDGRTGFLFLGYMLKAH